MTPGSAGVERSRYLAIMAACVSGLVGLVWWQGIFLPALLLTLLSWPRWAALVGKAAKIDAQWRDMGGVRFRAGVGRVGPPYFGAGDQPAVVHLQNVWNGSLV